MEQIRRVMRPTDVSFSPPLSPLPFGGYGSLGSEIKVTEWEWARG
jgi:hypothetical protein